MKRFLVAFLFCISTYGAMAQDAIRLICQPPMVAEAYFQKHGLTGGYTGKDPHGDSWALLTSAKGHWMLIYFRDDDMICAAVEGKGWKEIQGPVGPTN